VVKNRPLRRDHGSRNSLEVKKTNELADVDAISGATISSRAVINR